MRSSPCIARARRALQVSLLAAVAAVAGAVPAAVGAELPRAALQRLEDRGVRDIIVRRDPGLSAAERAAVRAGAGVDGLGETRLGDTEVVRAPQDGLVEALSRLDADPDVRYAEPDGPVSARSADPYWSLMWGLENTGGTILGVTGVADADIDAPDAWRYATGAGQTVAVVDSGVDASLPDLQDALATNPGESGAGRETNGVDDDGDGLVDDHRGWDFLGADNDPADLRGHGTHVAGTIAARKDNEIGIAGVAPDAKLLPLQVLGADGSGTWAAAAAAFDFAGDMGVPVVNASLGSPYPSNLVRDVIAAHPGTLYVVAAGNDGVSNEGSGADYPCAFPEPNIVCVGASDQRDEPASFSNFGPASVDLFAPGVSVLSTWPTLLTDCSSACYMSGTSMAAPHVAGVAALVVARFPRRATADFVYDRLKTTSDDLGIPGVDPFHGYGRVNAQRAVGR
jgi:thermitase